MAMWTLILNVLSTSVDCGVETQVYYWFASHMEFKGEMENFFVRRMTPGADDWLRKMSCLSLCHTVQNNVLTIIVFIQSYKYPVGAFFSRQFIGLA